MGLGWRILKSIANDTENTAGQFEDVVVEVISLEKCRNEMNNGIQLLSDNMFCTHFLEGVDTTCPVSI